MRSLKLTATFLFYSAISTVFLTPAVSAAKNHPVTGEKLAEEQTFIYRELDESPTLDPQLIEDVSAASVARDLFEGLLTQNADGTLAPGVALRWETNDSKDIYTFYLRDNAKWSNGDPVTAQDFVYSWQRLVDPELASPYAGYMELMAVKNAKQIIAGKMPVSELAVEALDDYTLRVELDASLPYFPSMLVHTSTMPSPRKVIEKLGNAWTKPGNLVGNGAYVLQQHVINERMVRVRNPLYWDNDKTIIDKVVSLVINDDNQALNRYKAGELSKSDVPAGQYKRLKKERPDETHSDPRLCSYYYLFNTDKEALKDKRVRRALSYAIDRDIITKNILGAGQLAAYSFTPGATANFNVPNVAFAQLTQKQRVAKAKQLMQEAGYGPGNPLKLSILYNTSEGHKKIAIAIRQMWKPLGVVSTLENQEWKTYLTTRQQGDFEVARASWCGDYNEASTFLDLVKSDSEHNHSHYSNEEIDALLAQATTMADPNPNYTRIEEIIATDFPIMPIYHYTSVLMLKPYVKGWPHKNVEQNWYSKNLYITAH